MAAALTSRERFQRMFEHREADRIPIIDSPWADTIERWHSEGMPRDVSFVDYFDLDHVVHVGGDSGPRWPSERLEETDEYVVDRTSWGVTLKNLKRTSVPQYLDFRINSPEAWQEAKERMQPARDRVDWDHLRRHYAGWREGGAWVCGGLWFGFDAAHAFTDMEQLLEAMIERPEWVADMFNTCLDASLAILEMIWDEGYTFDSVFWCDDMGYRGTQFFSLKAYRALLRPAQQRAIDWAHARGIEAHLHSCGNVMAFVPDLVDMGLDALNPLEVKAGMDALKLKREYGGRLVLHGGINAVLWDNLPAIEAEMRRVVPELARGGGFIFSSDHSVPSSVSLEGFRRIVELAKELGAYR
ncbi:MAG TPA: uroporphyrinogen decarboxylase family protein [Chthonomonadales bacterium]|nr:uroporphyrinogen decarboxylase family protein [Chthonomonadales bacterium]